MKNQNAVINTKDNACQAFNIKDSGVIISSLRVSAKKNYLLAGTNKGLYICSLKDFSCNRFSVGGVYEGGVTSISTPKVVEYGEEIYFVTTEKGDRRFYKYSFYDNLNGKYDFNLVKSPDGNDYWYSGSWKMTYIDHAPSTGDTSDRLYTAGYTTPGMNNRDITYHYFNSIGGYDNKNIICHQSPYKFLHDYADTPNEAYITAIMKNGDKGLGLKQFKIKDPCKSEIATELYPRYTEQGEKYSDIKEFPFLWSSYLKGFYVANHDDMEYFSLNVNYKTFRNATDMTIKKPKKPLMWDIKTMEFMRCEKNDCSKFLE